MIKRMPEPVPNTVLHKVEKKILGSNYAPIINDSLDTGAKSAKPFCTNKFVVTGSSEQ